MRIPNRNLLQETVDKMADHGKAPADVVYIGSRDGYACTWPEFSVLADREYDPGFGGQEVADDLEIHFEDGSWLERAEYDGSEWWEFRGGFTPPAETRPIVRLMRDEYHCSWSGLAALQRDKE